MPYKETMYNAKGEVIDSCPFKFEVSLDEIEKHNVQLILKPLDPRVFINRQYYNYSETETNFKGDLTTVRAYITNFFYNDDDDELILNVFNGFDVAIFNICSLLGIGRITLRKEVPYLENGFAPVHDKVGEIIFTLDEFKQLDGHVAWFKFTKHFIYFKGLVIGSNYIHESVSDDDRVPNYDSDVLLRGEKLFLID